MVLVVMMVVLLLLLVMRLLGEKQFRFAEIAPNALGRKVHVNAVSSVRLKVDGAVVLVLLGAPNVQTVFLQTYPQVWSIRLTVRARFILLELAQLHQR